jgi:hypothetical protein
MGYCSWSGVFLLLRKGVKPGLKLFVSGLHVAVGHVLHGTIQAGL